MISIKNIIKICMCIYIYTCTLVKLHLLLNTFHIYIFIIKMYIVALICIYYIILHSCNYVFSQYLFNV